MKLISKFNFDILTVVSSFLTPDDAEQLQLVDKDMFKFVYTPQAGFVQNTVSKQLVFNPKLALAYKQIYNRPITVKLSHGILQRNLDMTFQEISQVFANSRKSTKLEDMVVKYGRLYRDNHKGWGSFFLTRSTEIDFYNLFVVEGLVQLIPLHEHTFHLKDCTYYGYERDIAIHQTLQDERLFAHVVCKAFYERTIFHGKMSWDLASLIIHLVKILRKERLLVKWKPNPLAKHKLTYSLHHTAIDDTELRFTEAMLDEVIQKLHNPEINDSLKRFCTIGCTDSVYL